MINKINNRKLLKFFFKLLILLTFIGVVDFIIGFVLEYYYFKQESGLQYCSTYSMNKTRAEILIFGSSRASHHYCPQIFENNLKLSFYNVGRDGSSILYDFAVLKSILTRYKPKIIFLDFRRNGLKLTDESRDRLSDLLPYYKGHPEIRSIIALKSKYEKIKLISKIYPYNSLMFTIIAGNSQFNKIRRADYKGYVPLNKIWNEPLKVKTITPNYSVDSNKLEAYINFIKECKRFNIKLYIVCSPYFDDLTQEDYSITLAKRIANNFNTEFLDYSRYSEFRNNRNYFADVSHLNNTGASHFSEIILDSIKKIK